MIDGLPDLTEFQCGREPSWWVQVLGFALYMYVERWLGRTKFFTSASVWDLTINAFKTLLKPILDKLRRPTHGRVEPSPPARKQ